MKAERIKETESKNYVYGKSDKLEPILKWPGGKETELKYILPALPKSFARYFEPFVGGGSVYKSINAKVYFVNDKSDELISFYKMIADRDSDFFSWIESINIMWMNIANFVKENSSILSSMYCQYQQQPTSEESIRLVVSDFIDLKHAIFSEIFNIEAAAPPYPVGHLKKVLLEKLKRMKTIEDKNGILSEKNILENIETAFKSAYYTYLRELYNLSQELELSAPLRTALFYFLRNYAYSGMFRYNSKGNFNVPYGGMAYNRNTLGKKIAYFKSEKLQLHLARTTFCSLDFEAFFAKHRPTSKDFIFLDPPYDSEFSSYANNSFGQADQKRLADFLINRCTAKWMMVINNTEFIHSLYNEEKLSIQPFDKKYLVSFMNRNDKQAEHLLINNY